jgi:hypothetical protein
VAKERIALAATRLANLEKRPQIVGAIMIDTSKMTDTAFLRTLRMRYRSADQPEITIDEVRRLLDIASGFRMAPIADLSLGSKPLEAQTVPGSRV